MTGHSLESTHRHIHTYILIETQSYKGHMKWQKLYYEKDNNLMTEIDQKVWHTLAKINYYKRYAEVHMHRFREVSSWGIAAWLTYGLTY